MNCFQQRNLKKEKKWSIASLGWFTDKRDGPWGIVLELRTSRFGIEFVATQLMWRMGNLKVGVSLFGVQNLSSLESVKVASCSWGESGLPYGRGRRVPL